MSRPAFDLAILGGGCAGLSLAQRLARTRLRAVVIEPREAYADDRLWSFWRMRDHPFAGLARRRFSRWRVAAPGAAPVTRRSDAFAYESLPAGAVYDACLAAIDAAPGLRLARGTRAGAVRATPGGFRVETDRGAIDAAQVVDARPPRGRAGYGQFFEGREIATDGAAFDPGVATLMDFRRTEHAAIEFVYTVPFARDRALVELTWFAAAPPPPGLLARRLDEEIAALAPRGATTVRREAGAIPMTLARDAPPAPGVAMAGLAGGAARPSTGYAFQRIQAWADACAASLAAGGPALPAPRDPGLTRFMDALFLRVLTRDPAAGPALFRSLFANAPRDRLERFLSGGAGLADRASVVASLPPRRFVAEALHALA